MGRQALWLLMAGMALAGGVQAQPASAPAGTQRLAPSQQESGKAPGAAARSKTKKVSRKKAAKKREAAAPVPVAPELPAPVPALPAENEPLQLRGVRG